MKNKSQKPYESDLVLIRSLIMESNETPVLEYWAFYLWGGLSLVGTFLSLWLSKQGWTSVHLMAGVWLPVLVVGSAGETFAWIVKSRKESLPLLNKMMLRFMLSGMGVLLVVFFVVVLLLQTGNDAVLVKLILPLTSAIFFLYSPVTARFVAWTGYICLLVGLLFLLLIPLSSLAFVSGISASVLIFMTGLIGRILERKGRQK